MARQKFLYNLDETSANSIRGWVKHRRFSRPARVTLYHEGKLVGSATAAQYRQDLVDAGIGHGHYGFDITPNVNRASIDPVKVEIFFNKSLIDTRDIAPSQDETLKGFARVIEQRVDAMMALTRKRMQRELQEKLNALTAPGSNGDDGQ